LQNLGVPAITRWKCTPQELGSRGRAGQPPPAFLRERSHLRPVSV